MSLAHLRICASRSLRNWMHGFRSGPFPKPPLAARTSRAGIWRRSAGAPRRRRRDLGNLTAYSTRSSERSFEARILHILMRRHELFEDEGKLHLAIGPADLHVGQHALEVADVGGEALHFAEAFVHAVELVDDPRKAIRPSRASSVVCSFSSTVLRISSSFAAFSWRRMSSRPSTVSRSAVCSPLFLLHQFAQRAFGVFKALLLIEAHVGRASSALRSPSVPHVRALTSSRNVFAWCVLRRPGCAASRPSIVSTQGRRGLPKLQRPSARCRDRAFAPAYRHGRSSPPMPSPKLAAERAHIASVDALTEDTEGVDDRSLEA